MTGRSLASLFAVPGGGTGVVWMTLLACSTLLCLRTTVADDADQVDISVRVGFDGHAKVGFWTPVEVTVHAASAGKPGRIELVTLDADEVRTSVFSQPIQLSGNSVTRQLYIRFGRLDAPLTVRVHVDDEVIAQREFLPGEDDGFRELATSAHELIIAVGDPVGVAEAVQLRRIDEAERPIVVQLADISQLPRRWIGYEGVDVVVLATSRLDVYAGLSGWQKNSDGRIVFDDAELQALHRWILLGGRLLLTVAKQADELISTRQGGATPRPLTPFAPGRFEAGDVTRLLRSSAIEDWCDAKSTIQTDDGSELRFDVPRLTEADGVVELADQESDLVIRSRRGFGEILFVGLDLDAAPLKRWRGRGRFVARLLDFEIQKKADADNTPGMVFVGTEDRIEFVRGVMDEFGGVRVVPFALVAILIVVYIVLIGPVDYWFVRRVLKRMELTWVTFPIIVVAVSGAAYALAYYFKGSDLKANQVDIVDVDVGSGLVRGTTWSNIFSPKTRAYDLQLQPRSVGTDESAGENAEVLISWMGMPGSRLGGIDTETTRLESVGAYRFADDLSQIHGMPIPVWTSRPVSARWTWTTDRPTFQSDLQAGETDRLNGTMTNRLEIPLDDCVLVYGQLVYRLGTIQPGEEVDLANETKTLRLPSFLKQEATSTRSVESQILAMTFHSQTSGDGSKTSRFQPFMDLGGATRGGQALVIGRAKDDDYHAAPLQIDGETVGEGDSRRWVFFRFVLPVKKRGASDS